MISCEIMHEFVDAKWGCPLVGRVIRRKESSCHSSDAQYANRLYIVLETAPCYWKDASNALCWDTKENKVVTIEKKHLVKGNVYFELLPPIGWTIKGGVSK